MNFSISEMIALQDVTVTQQRNVSIKEITPTKFYALSSCVFASIGVYWIASLFAKLASGSFNLRTADLIIQTNFIIFILIALAVLVSPWLKLQRYRVRINGDTTQLFHYQEVMVVLSGILFANIPLLFLANAVSMFEQISQMESLSAEVLSYMESSYFYHQLTMSDVLVCGSFGVVLLVIKSWVFTRVARRFVQNKRFRAAVR